MMCNIDLKKCLNVEWYSTLHLKVDGISYIIFNSYILFLFNYQHTLLLYDQPILLIYKKIYKNGTKCQHSS